MRLKGKYHPAKIAPLLFEPFIDNAFKHGLPGSKESDYIVIKLNFPRLNELNFVIENNYIESEGWDKKRSGIGISNVKKRLKLLYRSNEYKLEIKKENQVHLVSLWLKLKT